MNQALPNNRRWQCLALGVILATVTAWATPAMAQEAAPPPAKEKTYVYVEQMPELVSGGGLAAIVLAIQANVHYPQQARAVQAEGKVYVSFTVSKKGDVKNIKIVKSIGHGFDEAVIEAVNKLPPFTPGKQKGRPVPVRFTVPVTFKLTDPSPEELKEKREQK